MAVGRVFLWIGIHPIWARMAEYLRHVPDEAGALAPKALVVISGHWEEPVVTIQNNPAPPLLYDYYGFPPSTYEIKFPASGAPAVSARIAELLETAGIPWKYDHERGFDHGVFIPLKVAFPKADVPIVQVSLLASMDAAAHLRVGEALVPLRDEGVLIIGRRHDLPQYAHANGEHAPRPQWPCRE